MSCERRSAHAIPAGPPPTITTSAGIWGRSTPSIGLRKTSIEKSFATDLHGSPRIRHLLAFSCESVLIRGCLSSRFRLLHFLDQRRADFEQVAYDRLVGNF